MSKDKGKKGQSKQRALQQKAHGGSFKGVAWSGLARRLLGVARNQRGHKEEGPPTEFGLYFEDEGRGGKGRGDMGRRGGGWRGEGRLCILGGPPRR